MNKRHPRMTPARTLTLTGGLSGARLSKTLFCSALLSSTLLTGSGTRLLQWRREGERLQAGVASAETDPRRFVSAFQGHPVLSVPPPGGGLSLLQLLRLRLLNDLL